MYAVLSKYDEVFKTMIRYDVVSDQLLTYIRL